MRPTAPAQTASTQATPTQAAKGNGPQNGESPRQARAFSVCSHSIAGDVSLAARWETGPRHPDGQGSEHVGLMRTRRTAPTRRGSSEGLLRPGASWLLTIANFTRLTWNVNAFKELFLKWSEKCRIGHARQPRKRTARVCLRQHSGRPCAIGRKRMRGMAHLLTKPCFVISHYDSRILLVPICFICFYRRFLLLTAGMVMDTARSHPLLPSPVVIPLATSCIHHWQKAVRRRCAQPPDVERGQMPWTRPSLRDTGVKPSRLRRCMS